MGSPHEQPGSCPLLRFQIKQILSFVCHCATMHLLASCRASTQFKKGVLCHTSAFQGCPLLNWQPYLFRWSLHSLDGQQGILTAWTSLTHWCP